MARAQALHCASAVYDIGVRCVGQEFVEVVRPERSVPPHSTINSLPRAIASWKQRYTQRP
jgi:hypothetical protein